MRHYVAYERRSDGVRLFTNYRFAELAELTEESHLPLDYQFGSRRTAFEQRHIAGDISTAPDPTIFCFGPRDRLPVLTVTLQDLHCPLQRELNRPDFHTQAARVLTVVCRNNFFRTRDASRHLRQVHEKVPQLLACRRNCASLLEVHAPPARARMTACASARRTNTTAIARL